VCAVRSLVRTNRGNSRPGGCDRVGGNRLGILTNAHLVRGASGMGERFGHVQLIRRAGLPLRRTRMLGGVRLQSRGRSLLSESQSATGGPPVSRSPALGGEGRSPRLKAFEKMARYLGRGLRMISAGLAPEVIVVVGEFTRLWHRFGPGHRSGGRGPDARRTQASGRTGSRRPECPPARTIALILPKTFRPTVSAFEIRYPSPHEQHMRYRPFRWIICRFSSSPPR